MYGLMRCGFLIVVLHLSAGAQVEGIPGAEHLHRDFLYSRIHLQLRDGTSAVGMLAGIAGDTLRILHKGTETAVSLETVRRFEIETTPNYLNAGLLGAILGAYVGTIAVGQSATDPVGYLDANEEFFPYSLLFAIPGFALGALVGMGVHGGSESFTIEGTEQEITERIADVKEFLSGGMPPRAVHLTVQGGWFSQRISRETDLFRRYPPGPYSYYYYWTPGLDQESHVNLLRKVQGTVSLFRWLEAGAAIIQFSQPGVSGFTETGRSDTLISYLQYTEKLSATAYALVGSVEPLGQFLSRAIRWKAGIGIGVAKLDLQSTRAPGSVAYVRYPYSQSYRYWQTALGPVTQQGFATTTLALSAFTTVDVYPSAWLSIGFAMDYTFCPSERYPAVPELGLSSSMIGNTCIGFTFGVHF